jgi:hypothetical protein
MGDAFVSSSEWWQAEADEQQQAAGEQAGHTGGSGLDLNWEVWLT